MEDPTKTAKDTAGQPSTDEVIPEIPDYEQELQEQVEKFDRADKNREGYQQRKAQEKETDDDVDDIDAKVAAALAKELPKIVPKLQSTLAEDVVENTLNEFAAGNDAKKKLIRFHFENSVGTVGTIRERMENATLIADKKAIFKKQEELATALKHRAGLEASGLGVSTEGHQVADNILSTDLLNEFKSRGWDDKKIERFKQNLRR